MENRGGKRPTPETSFEFKGPASPEKDPTFFDMAHLLTSSPDGAGPAINKEDESTIERLMPIILLKLQPQICSAIEKAADAAISKYRDEIKAKDEIIETLRAELTNLRSAPDPSSVGQGNQNIGPSTFRNTDSPPSCLVELEALQQYSRRNSVVIRKIPVKDLEGKSSDAFVIDIARAVGVDINDFDICRSHQLGKIYEGHVSIIVKFVRHNIKHKLLKARKNLKLLPGKIIFQESLTPIRREIFKRIDSLRYQKKLYSTWSDDGKVLFKIFENSPTVRVPVEKYVCNGDLAALEKWISDMRDGIINERKKSRNTQSANMATGGSSQ